MLLTSIILVTISVSKGLGKHAYAVPPHNFATLGLIGNFTGTFSILDTLIVTRSIEVKSIS